LLKNIAAGTEDQPPNLSYSEKLLRCKLLRSDRKSLLFRKNFLAKRHCEAIEESPLFRKNSFAEAISPFMYVIAKR
jgi:hypothetical protein